MARPFNVSIYSFLCGIMYCSFYLKTDVNNNVATEGIGLTGTVSFPALHFGLLTFGFGAGASNYKMLSKENK